MKIFPPKISFQKIMVTTFFWVSSYFGKKVYRQLIVGSQKWKIHENSENFLFFLGKNSCKKFSKFFPPKISFQKIMVTANFDWALILFFHLQLFLGEQLFWKKSLSTTYSGERKMKNSRKLRKFFYFFGKNSCEKFQKILFVKNQL